MTKSRRPSPHTVKITDVAAAAGTSVATVSRVLNDTANVNAAVAERVHAAVAALGYRANALGRNLRRRGTRLWMLVISDIENPFFTAVARGVEDIAQQHGYSVVLCNADEHPEKEAAYLALACAEQAAGVILSPHSAASDISILHGAGVPVVTIDRPLADSVDSVTTDSRRGACTATRHLLDEGWLRPACLTGPVAAHTARERRLGFLDAAPDAAHRVTSQPFSEGGGRAGITALLAQRERPDAYFVANSALALGALTALRDHGIRPGRDAGLVIFDDAPWASLLDPPVSVVAQPSHAVGSAAAELLLTRMAGDGAPPPRHVVLETSLLVRGSSLRPESGTAAG